ncbi:hypothetical protein [Cupriavidus basilensis]|uniref:hypothetical protein n=1 Tax=Cupriavidus basilensis TaxID=68895 RepID=UPI00130D6BA9|nr:hypothetical protein [Cupriavidus basilensis]
MIPPITRMMAWWLRAGVATAEAAEAAEAADEAGVEEDIGGSRARSHEQPTLRPTTNKPPRLSAYIGEHDHKIEINRFDAYPALRESSTATSWQMPPARPGRA